MSDEQPQEEPAVTQPAYAPSCEITGFGVITIDTPTGPMKAISVSMQAVIPMHAEAIEQMTKALSGSKVVLPGLGGPPIPRTD